VLRLLFVGAAILFGAVQSTRGPFYALLFYLWYAYFRPETWVWTSTLQQWNISFYIGIWVVLSTVLSSKEKFARTIPVMLIGIFLLHGLAGTLMSLYWQWSIDWWRNFAKIAAVTILIVSLVNTQERFRLAIIVIAVALGLEGVKQGIFYLVTRPGERNLNEVEILGDNNGVAVGMLMLSAMLLALFQSSQSKWQKSAFAFMTLGCVFRALSTFSRGGMLAFVAMTAIYWSRSKHKVRTGLLIGILGVGLLSALPPQYWERMNTINVEADERDFSASGRLFFWSVAVDMANDRPFFGVGHTGFQAWYDQYDPSGGAYGIRRAVHSTWFGILAEQGYVGFVMLVTIIALAFRACGRARKLTRGVPDCEQLFAMAGGMQSALVAAVVGGSFLSYHYVEVLWHFVGLGLAIERAAVYEIARRTSGSVAAALAPSIAGIPPPGSRLPAHLLPAPAVNRR
jgi:putative inorganic carbon (HCO3(-)) transporter